VLAALLAEPPLVELLLVELLLEPQPAAARATTAPMAATPPARRYRREAGVNIDIFFSSV
jgi:hypothetical protein